MGEQGKFELIDKSLIAAKTAENSAIGKNVAIGVEGIVSLDEYTSQILTDGKDESMDIDQKEEKEKIPYFVVPITLPSGDKLDLIVNNNGKDIATVYRDDKGNVLSLELSPDVKKDIAKSITGVETKLDPNMILQALTPGTLEELQRDLEDENLIPESQKEAIDKIKTKYPDAEIDYNEELDDKRKSEIEEKEEEKKEEEEAKEELPPEIRDELARICSENNLDIRKVKEYMQVSPQVLTGSLDNTGFDENGQNIDCVRFSGVGTQDRIVMVQPGGKTVDERRYDEYVSDYMTEHRGIPPEKTASDEHDTIYYTDPEGNTTIHEIHKEPMDLTCVEKEQLQEELEKLNDSANQIMNSSLSPEQKAEELTKINGKRLQLFEDYGISVSSAENLILEDTEKVQDTIQEPEENTVEKQENTEDEEHGFPEEHSFPDGPWSRPGRFFN